jgi:hypothetical protein
MELPFVGSYRKICKDMDKDLDVMALLPSTIRSSSSRTFVAISSNSSSVT